MTLFIVVVVMVKLFITSKLSFLFFERRVSRIPSFAFKEKNVPGKEKFEKASCIHGISS
jgi:hypothetical protein